MSGQGHEVWPRPDAEALRRALEEVGEVGELGSPGLTDYLLDLGTAVEGWLVSWLGVALPPGLDLSWVERVATLVLLGAGAIAVAWLGVRLWRRRRPRRLAPAVELTAEEPSGPSPPSPPDYWLSELERRLAQGRPRAALEALWWWTATTLAPEGLSDSWTSDQLLQTRPERRLRSSLLHLDRLLYGSGSPPAVADVAALRHELGEAVR